MAEERTILVGWNETVRIGGDWRIVSIWRVDDGHELTIAGTGEPELVIEAFGEGAGL